MVVYIIFLAFVPPALTLAELSQRDNCHQSSVEKRCGGTRRAATELLKNAKE
jgi:hypothetical protein